MLGCRGDLGEYLQTGDSLAGWPGLGVGEAVPDTGGRGTLGGFRLLPHLAQDAVDLGEPGPLAWVPLPALKHQSVQLGGAVPGGRQAEAILYSLDDLGSRGGYRQDVSNYLTYGTTHPTPHHPRDSRQDGCEREVWEPRGQRSIDRGQGAGSIGHLHLVQTCPSRAAPQRPSPPT